MRTLLLLLALLAVAPARAVEIDAIADTKNIGWSNAAFDKDVGGNIDVLLSGTMVFSFTPTAVILGSGVTLDAAGLSGTIAAARMPALTGDVTTTVGTVATTIAADAVALGTDTTGGYAASATEGGAATTATAAAANGANCSAGQWAAGVDASWAAEGCTADDDQPDADAEVPDAITVSAGTVTNSDLTLKAGTAPTVDGRIEYDTTLEALVLGDDGTGTKTLYPGLRAASVSDGGPATTATALAANGANCSAGNYPLGVDASGNVESCTAAGGLGGSLGSTDNAVLRADGTGGATAQGSTCTWSDANVVTCSANSSVEFNSPFNGDFTVGQSGANNVTFDHNSGGITTQSDWWVGWSNSTSDSQTTIDTKLYRHSAGVVRCADDTAGSIRCLLGGGGTIASATALPVPTGRVFHVSGTTTITSITSTNFEAGACVTLIFDGVLTFTDGSNLKLAGDFVTTADDTISLCYDSSAWYEVSRSVN